MVDLRHRGVVLDGGVGVDALGVEVANAVVGFDDAAEFPVSGVVEAGVGREDQQPPGLVTPADL